MGMGRVRESKEFPRRISSDGRPRPISLLKAGTLRESMEFRLGVDARTEVDDLENDPELLSCDLLPPSMTCLSVRETRPEGLVLPLEEFASERINPDNTLVAREPDAGVGGVKRRVPRGAFVVRRAGVEVEAEELDCGGEPNEYSSPLIATAGVPVDIGVAFGVLGDVLVGDGVGMKKSADEEEGLCEERNRGNSDDAWRARGRREVDPGDDEGNVGVRSVSVRRE